MPFAPFQKEGTSFEIAQERPKHNHNHNFPKTFASDATPKRHLMAYQMKNLCGFSVFHCIEGAFGASFIWGGTPKMKNGAPRDELKNGCVVVFGPSLNYTSWEKETIHHPATVRNFSLPKEWGPQRKAFGGRYRFPSFYRVIAYTTGLEVSFGARKVFQMIFFRRWWQCTLFLPRLPTSIITYVKIWFWIVIGWPGYRAPCPKTIKVRQK